MRRLLRHCPFCKDRHPVLRVQDGWAQVECEACGAKGPVFGDEDTPISTRRIQAIDGWNVGTHK